MSWIALVEDFRRFSISAICVILAVPPCSGQASPVCTPITLIIVASLFYKPIINAKRTLDDLDDIIDNQSKALPAWINKCLIDDISFDQSIIDENVALANEWRSKVSSLFIFMTIYNCLIAFLLVLPILVLLVICLYKSLGYYETLKENFKDFPKAFCGFLRAY